MNLGDVPLLYTASVTGRVIDEESGLPIPFATVVDDLSILTVVADADGVFTFPSLAIGDHTLRAAGSILIDDDTSSPMVGGTLTVSLTREHERKELQLGSPLPLRDATGRGRVQFDVGFMTPGSEPFGLDEIVVKATECGGTREITLTPPSSNGQVDDDQVPEGCWNIRLEPPEGPHSAEFTLQTEVDNIVVLADTEVDLGKLLLVSTPSLFKSRNSCDVGADCGEGGACEAGQCSIDPSRPADPCEENNGGCHDNATCSSTDGGLVLCSCDDGFVGNGLSCTDIDECTEVDPDTRRPLHGCGPNSICVNEPGAWSCQCADGFVDVEGTCVDVALCDCDDTRVCVEDSGSYTCECAGGFRDEDGVCVDIDECTEADPETEAPLHDCGPNSFCVNGTGSYSCECDEGFRNEDGVCVDIDECTEFDRTTGVPLQACDVNAVCVNLDGSYDCVCEEGFSGDGFQCVDVDECPEGLDRCDPAATCINAQGSYVCECNDGYVGDGFSCNDIDECAEGLDGCDPSATCTNTPGGYECSCPAGIVDDGHPCEVSLVQIVVGDIHSCGLKSDGSLWCWGGNHNGQLGVGDDQDRTEPTAVEHPEGKTWSRVYAAGDGTCAIDSSDLLWCWGSNHSNQLGLGPEWEGISAPHPTLVSPDITWATVGLASFDGCGVSTDNKLFCWGGRDLSPMQKSPEADWIDVIAGDGNHCGIRRMPPEDGEGDTTYQAWCWGDNHASQFDSEETFINDPVALTLPSKEPPEFILPAGAVCILATMEVDGPATRHLFCWGGGYEGTHQISTDSWATVTVAGDSFCGIDSDGDLRCWGGNSRGVTGTGMSGPVPVPTPVAGGLRASTVALGYTHACALTVGSELYCWGSNAWGQLAYPDFPAVTSPVQVGIGSDWEYVTSGTGNTCGIRAGGMLWCWGDNMGGKLLQDPQVSQYLPEPTPFTTAFRWNGLSLRDAAGCGLDEDGVLWCWGNSYQYSSDYQFDEAPVPVKSEYTFWSVEVGSTFTCAIDAEEQLWCSGGLSEMVSGLGSPGRLRNEPLAGVLNESRGEGWEIVDQSSGNGWSAISVAEDHACGIRNGRLFCFGINDHGKLGNETTSSTTVPVEVLEDDVNQPIWGMVSVGVSHGCAIDADQQLWCWGDNSHGQLGLPPGEENGIGPHLIGERGWRSVSAGDLHTCAIRGDRSGWCWGANGNSSALGLGHFDPVSGPQQLDGTWATLSASAGRTDMLTQKTDNHTCGVRMDGTLWCGVLQPWGRPAPIQWPARFPGAHG